MKTKPYKRDKSPLGYSVGTTLDRFIKSNQSDFPYSSGELSQLLRDIAFAAKIVNREINRAGLANIIGTFGAINPQGEKQQNLDVIANIRFTRALAKGGEVCAIISEEEAEVIDLKNKKGKYIVAIDPLDGSSNIDVNISLGTIFAIYRRISPHDGPITSEDVLQPGTNQVAAGYVHYGSSTMIVYTTGKGVNGFTYEPSLGEFFLSHPQITAPSQGTIYSINEGLNNLLDAGVKGYLKYCKDHNYSGRYIGSLVPDFHRNLLKGGIYLYPSTGKAPNGKIRLLYEAQPLAFIAEQAGASASNGKERILAMIPESLHQRTPIYIGSCEMVSDAVNFLNLNLTDAQENGSS